MITVSVADLLAYIVGLTIILFLSLQYCEHSKDIPMKRRNQCT